MNKASTHPRLEDRYFERMMKSLGDKERIVSYMPPVTPTYFPRVLDIGAGGGDLSEGLRRLGYDVTAVDVSDDAIAHIKATYPFVNTARLYANEVHKLNENFYDVVICSSILHEVFSYGDTINGPGYYSSLDNALDSFYRCLKRDGILIIRDGVLPDNWDTQGEFTMLGGDSDMVESYLALCPFANNDGVITSGLGDVVQLTRVNSDTFSGTIRSILEFSYTYTWGKDSYPRETQELYALKTLNEYVSLLQSHNFTVTHKESYLQDGYPRNLNDKIRLDIPGVNEWFDSNAIWVAQK